MKESVFPLLREVFQSSKIEKNAELTDFRLFRTKKYTIIKSILGDFALFRSYSIIY